MVVSFWVERADWNRASSDHHFSLWEEPTGDRPADARLGRRGAKEAFDRVDSTLCVCVGVMVGSSCVKGWCYLFVTKPLFVGTVVFITFFDFLKYLKTRNRLQKTRRVSRPHPSNIARTHPEYVFSFVLKQQLQNTQFLHFRGPFEAKVASEKYTSKLLEYRQHTLSLHVSCRNCIRKMGFYDVPR